MEYLLGLLSIASALTYGSGAPDQVCTHRPAGQRCRCAFYLSTFWAAARTCSLLMRSQMPACYRRFCLWSIRDQCIRWSIRHVNARPCLGVRCSTTFSSIY